MESTSCYLGLALLWGIFIGVLLLEGNNRRKAALDKIKSSKTDEKKAKESLEKAKEKRKQGYRELPNGLLLLLLAFILTIVAILLLSGGQGF